MSNKKHISELIPDDKNFNKHTEFGMSLLEKSVQKFGMGRSILIDKNNRIIAGNGIVETAGNIGIEDVEVIETDGKKIIAVKRTDIDLDSPEGREMALADNATSEANLQWNFKEIEKEMGAKAAEWGVAMLSSANDAKKSFDKESSALSFAQEWFLNISFQNEVECQKWYEKLTKEGLSCKIIQ